LLGGDAGIQSRAFVKLDSGGIFLKHLLASLFCPAPDHRGGRVPRAPCWLRGGRAGPALDVSLTFAPPAPAHLSQDEAVD
jgi:hypothetical protein